MLSEIESLCDKVIFINNGQIIDVKSIDKNVKKKNILFEVDDFSKAKLLLKNYCINEELEVYESDSTISMLNRELIFNNINVYRIYERENIIEKEFFDMINKDEASQK